jgi:hypothetical protein
MAVNNYFIHSNPWFMLSTGPLAPDRLPRICVFLVGSVAHYKYAIDQTAGIYFLRAADGFTGKNHDFSIADSDVANRVQPGSRVHHPAIADDDVVISGESRLTARNKKSKYQPYE